MVKKAFALICAALLTLLPAIHVGAELNLNQTGNKADDIVIFYVPATADETIIRTARYVAQSIYEANSERTVNLYRSDSNPKDEFDPQKSINKGAVKGDDEFKVIKAKNIERFEKKAHEYWVLVPLEAADAFSKNTKMMERFRSLLSKEGVVMHIVLIGDKTKEPAEGSALSKLKADCNVDWIRIRSDFQAETVDKDYSSGETLHTGDYLLAYMIGRKVPLDLAVDQEGGNWKFKPVGKNALLVIRWAGEPNTPSIINPDGEPHTDKKDKAIVQQGNTGYLVIQIDGLNNEKEYTVKALGADTVKAYYYPDFASIKPTLELPKQAMIGENTLQLRTANFLGGHEMDVRFDIYKNEETEAIEETAKFNSDKKVWIKKINLDKSYKFFSVSYRAYVFMEDGNRVWIDDHAEKQQLMLEIGGVKALENAESITLYYDSRTPGVTALKPYEWNKFFSFNPGDFEDLQKEVAVVDEVLTNAGLTAEMTEDGKISIALDTKNGKIEEGSALTGIVKLTLNGQSYQLGINLKDVNELYEEIRLSIQEETIHAGEKPNVIATIDADAIKDWEDAKKQIDDFPDVKELQLFVAGDANGEPMRVQEEDGLLQAQKSSNITGTPGSNTITAQIKAGEDTIREENLSFEVINTPPYLQAEAPDEKQEIALNGWPWQYTPIENLLKVLTGVDKPTELFSDEEGIALSAKVFLDSDKGLELPEDAEKQQGNDSWIISLSNQDPAVITAIEPGEHKLTIIASDGVNDSEPLEISFKVYSVVLRYVSYAALGLAALLLILVIILIIHQARKPSFDRISIRCCTGTDEDAELAKEVLNKSNPVSMMNFGKKPVTLTTALILTRQPPMNQEMTKITDDIILLPTKHDELSIRFGKKALGKMGRHEKKELLSRGNTHRMRIGNTYIQIENVQH